MESKLVRNRIKYSEKDLKLYFNEYNLFPLNKKGMNADEFKKNFFPHLYLVQEDVDDAEEKEEYKN